MLSSNGCSLYLPVSTQSLSVVTGVLCIFLCLPNPCRAVSVLSGSSVITCVLCIFISYLNLSYHCQYFKYYSYQKYSKCDIWRPLSQFEVVCIAHQGSPTIDVYKIIPLPARLTFYEIPILSCCWSVVSVTV